MPKRGLIVSVLPAALREELKSRLLQNGFGHYEELAAWLNREGYPISKSSVHRYGKKLERQLQAWRAPVVGNVAEKHNEHMAAATARLEIGKLRESIGTLIIVMDAPTRETWIYATHHSPAQTRAAIERAISPQQQKEKSPT